MAYSIPIRRARRDPSTGRIIIRLASKREYEFESLAELKQRAIDIEEELTVLLLFVRWWLHRDANGTTPSTVEGKTFTLDLSQTNAVVVE